MNTFIASLDVLVQHGHSNALELATQIELQLTSFKKKRPVNTFESDVQRLFDIVYKYYPRYCVKRVYAKNEGWVSLFRDTTLEAIESKSRLAELVKARHIIMVILQLNYGCNIVGRRFNRDHATALHAKKAVADRFDTDKRYRETFEQIKSAYLESF